MGIIFDWGGHWEALQAGLLLKPFSRVLKLSYSCKATLRFMQYTRQAIISYAISIARSPSFCAWTILARQHHHQLAFLEMIMLPAQVLASNPAQELQTRAV